MRLHVQKTICLRDNTENGASAISTLISLAASIQTQQKLLQVKGEDTDSLIHFLYLIAALQISQHFIHVGTIITTVRFLVDRVGRLNFVGGRGWMGKIHVTLFLSSGMNVLTHASCFCCVLNIQSHSSSVSHY